MSTYLLVTVAIKNREKFQEYAQAAGATMTAYGSKALARGPIIETICGGHNADIAAVVEFESVERLKAWYASDDYQTLIPLRDEGADVHLSVIHA